MGFTSNLRKNFRFDFRFCDVFVYIKCKGFYVVFGLILKSICKKTAGLTCLICGMRMEKLCCALKKCLHILVCVCVVSFMNCLFGCGLGFENVHANSGITLVTWNVQTFFDGVKHGCEYDEFKKSSNWNQEKYLERLHRLCDAIAELDADVFVLQEIENEAVIQDICNQLAGRNWNAGKNWNYSCFAKPENTAIGCAVLSRFELSEMKVHDLDVRIHSKNQPSLRYLMKVNVNIGGKDFVLMVCHWKSKSGGSLQTEIWRDWNESVLATQLQQTLELDGVGNLPVVICGDFNRDVREFIPFSKADEWAKADADVCENTKTGVDSANILLRAAGIERKEEVTVYSPWFTDDGELFCNTGTYFYKNNWEYIDQIFCKGNIRITEFSPCTNGPWITGGGLPFSYKIYNGNGYSDHLPLKCKISF